MVNRNEEPTTILSAGLALVLSDTAVRSLFGLIS